MKKVPYLFAAFLVLVFGAVVQESSLSFLSDKVSAEAESGNTSILWGQNGELWTGDNGRLADFSYSGYGGQDNEPDTASWLTIDVTSVPYNADNTGSSNAAQSIQQAIDQAGIQGNTVVYIPDGTYLMESDIAVTDPNVVIRGESRKNTVLAFNTGLFSLDRVASLNDARTRWDTGQGGMVQFYKKTTKAGLISNLDQSQSIARGSRSLETATAVNINHGTQIVLYLVDSATPLGNNNLYSDVHDGLIDPVMASNQDGTQQFSVVVTVDRVEGTTVFINEPIPIDISPGQYTTAQLRKYVPLKQVGLESLTIKFPQNYTYTGHISPHTYFGYNAVEFFGANNCWADDILIKNAENGVRLTNYSNQCTIDGVRMRRNGNAPGYYDGHYGISIGGSNGILVKNFNLKNANLVHDLSLVGLFATGNVFKDGMGQDIVFDHHSLNAVNNLFSNIDTGLGTEPFYSSGGDLAQKSGLGETYWNIRDKYGDYPGQITAVSNTNTDISDFPSASVVGSQLHNTSPAHDTVDYNVFFELFVEDLFPADLHQSQLDRRITQQ